MECTRIILSAAHRYFLGESLIQLLAVGIQFLANLAAGCQKNQDLVWDHFYMHLKWVVLCMCQSLSLPHPLLPPAPLSLLLPLFQSVCSFVCFSKSVWCPPNPPPPPPFYFELLFCDYLSWPPDAKMYRSWGLCCWDCDDPVWVWRSSGSLCSSWSSQNPAFKTLPGANLHRNSLMYKQYCVLGSTTLDWCWQTPH